MYPDQDKDKYLTFLWAHELVSGEYGDWVVLDTETTGLDSNAEAIEIAILSKYGSTLLNTLVKPTIEVTPEASAVHGITSEELEDAPTFEQVFPEIERAIAFKEVVIYNANFDCRILEYQSQLHGLTLPKFRSHCAMKWYAQYYGAWHSYWENYTWQKLPGASHRARGDASATYNLVKQMAKPLACQVNRQTPLFPPRQIAIKWEPVYRICLRIYEEENWGYHDVKTLLRFAFPRFYWLGTSRNTELKEDDDDLPF